MVQFLSIIFFSWISSIFVGVFKKFPFFCVTLYISIIDLAVCGLRFGQKNISDITQMG